jgi:hypothetical protein
MNRQASVTPSLVEERTVSRVNQGTEISPALRKTIIWIFSKKYGLQLHSSAISFIHLTLESHGLLQDQDEWAEAIEWLAKGLVESAGKGEQGEYLQKAHCPFQTLISLLNCRLFDSDASST